MLCMQPTCNTYSTCPKPMTLSRQRHYRHRATSRWMNHPYHRLFVLRDDTLKELSSCEGGSKCFSARHWEKPRPSRALADAHHITDPNPLTTATHHGNHNPHATAHHRDHQHPHNATHQMWKGISTTLRTSYNRPLTESTNLRAGTTSSTSVATTKVVPKASRALSH